MPILDHVIIEQILKDLKLSSATEGCPVVIGGEANVGANVGVGEGEVYRDKTGVTLNFRTLKEGSGVTIETIDDEIVITSTAGGIVGPDPSTLRAIATWADLTGTALYNNVVRIDDPDGGSDYRGIEILSTEDPQEWRTALHQKFLPANGIGGGWYNLFGDSALGLILKAIGDPYVGTPASTSRILYEGISTPWEITQPGTVTSSDPDTSKVLSLKTLGANGETVSFYSGSRNPELQVTATPGSLYYRSSGTSSALYQLRSSTFTNTPWVEVAGLGDIAAADVSIEKVSGATFDDAQEAIDHFGIAGTSDHNIPHITDAGGGSINVAAGRGYLRNADSHDAPLLAFDWAAAPGLAIPSGSVRYVGVEYNAGAPQVLLKTSDDWDFHTDFRLGSVVNEAGTLHILNGAQLATDFGGHIFERFFETEPYVRTNRFGGLVPADAGTRNLIMSAGGMFDGFTEYSISAIDTSGADTFDYYYRDGVGGWTKQAAQSQWNNTQYDDGSGTLASLSPNRFGVHWLYLEADGNLVLLYGRGNYNTQAGAEAETAPATVPLRVQSHGRLLGRLVFQQNASTAIEVENVWDDVFAGSASGGDVFGPASAVDESITLFDGATGKLIQDSPAKVTQPTVKHNVIQVQEPSSPNAWIDVAGVKDIPANGIGGAQYIVFGDRSNPTVLYSLTDPYVGVGVLNEGRLIHEKISVPWAIEERGSVEQDSGDTTYVFILKNSGTNPGEYSTFVGNRDPNSNVTGSPGDMYYQENGLSSRCYQHRGSVSSNSDWVEISPNVGFYGYRSSGTQSISATTETKVEFPNERDDDGGDFSTSTYVFTAPRDGRYSFAASVRALMSAAGSADLRLYSSTHGLISEGRDSSASTTTLVPNVYGSVWMDASETMEVRVETSVSSTLQATGLNFSGAQIVAG